MSAALGSWPLAVPTFILSAFVLTVITGAIYTRLQTVCAELAPQLRANLLLALLLLPIVLGAVHTALLFSPSVGAALIDVHCHAGHTCAAHAPDAPTGPLAGTIALAAGAMPVIFAAAVGFHLRRLRRSAQTMTRAAVPHRCADLSCGLLKDARPVACSVGWLRPAVLLSTGLLRAASPAELAVIFAHEQAHARRRDNLRHSVAEIAAWFFPPPYRRRLLSDLHLASEQFCDAAAARCVGNPYAVARTLVRIATLQAPRTPLGVCSIFGCDAHPARGAHLEARVRALLKPAAMPARCRCGSAMIGATFGAAILLAVLVLGVAPLHHAIEWLASGG